METADLATARDTIRRFWNRDGSDYDANHSHGTHSEAEEDRWRTALTSLPTGSDVADLGAGTGFVALLLAELGHRVTAVDWSASMMSEAARKATERELSISLEVAELERLPFEDGALDAVTARHVLWTLLDPEAAFAEWRRVLREGGLAVVDLSLDAEKGAHYEDEVEELLPLRGTTDPEVVIDLFLRTGFSGVDVAVDKGEHHTSAIYRAHV
jgi:ubiquinone/menaquinone biosynthesis C-methylase UbiE